MLFLSTFSVDNSLDNLEVFFILEKISEFQRIDQISNTF